MWATWTSKKSGACALALLLAGCTVNTSPGTTYKGSGPVTGYTTAATQPMLVVVDADRVMTAQPGDGVGVFTEYGAGGHWHIWWSCDTNRTGFLCDFDVNVALASGSIANPAGEALAPNDQFLQWDAAQIEVVTRTSAGVQGVSFDAPPGEIITVDARLNGQADGSLFFFVQGGQINGGYRGALTDPLMLQPSSP